MKNTFLNRVSAERKVLKVVNTLFPGNLQLAGLSQAALRRWESAVGQCVATFNGPCRAVPAAI